ncbi:DUF411 domain-containing protein [Bordetella petrii]|uniref:Secreted protein n=1 Tax=Bordetella petrii (strain ATCC BAA-461 / DSM 12804 / CCUG 43448 / CIP 107267 / Se-1111R) TaxID=340100 RepID=A9IF10_BORPD|nr:DUF411 domain-containing protein [Bordetella petrii]MBO1112159.1 DUF411 domain-containing protein [Bordetella petrii]MBO9354697.1 DUF411 domain-containing protein [Bordetella petrii]CAP44940.1 putative secreted protein [Bordetella petrii]
MTLLESEGGYLSRRAMLAAVALIPVASLAKTAVTVDVWKTSTCGCCKDWVKYLQDNGFQVSVRDVTDTSVARRQNRIPDDYGSCHSARVEGYALEGHVPAREIRRLLRERPAAVGLAVPSMPLGSPGMDGPAYGGKRFAYDVFLIGNAGEASVYQQYR